MKITISDCDRRTGNRAMNFLHSRVAVMAMNIGVLPKDITIENHPKSERPLHHYLGADA